MKKFLILAVALLTIGAGSVHAQRTGNGQGFYNRAIGINLGLPFGVNYKQFLANRDALEFSLGYVNSGVMFTALYQYHVNLVENFNMYVGGGVNVGLVGLSHRTQFALGIDPTVGFEYKFSEAPIVLALDYAPQINIFSPINLTSAAFKIRFVF